MKIIGAPRFILSLVSQAACILDKFSLEGITITSFVIAARTRAGPIAERTTPRVASHTLNNAGLNDFARQWSPDRAG